MIALAEEIESLEDVFIQMTQAANAEDDSSEDVNTEQLTSDSETETLSTDDDTENLTSDEDAEQSETTSNTDVLIDGLRKTLSGKESD